MASSSDNIDSSNNQLVSLPSSSNKVQEEDAVSCSSETTVSDEFYDAVEDKNETELSGSGLVGSGQSKNVSTNQLKVADSLTAPTTSHMADSGIFSMHSSHVDAFHSQPASETTVTNAKLEEAIQNIAISSSSVNTNGQNEIHAQQLTSQAGSNAIADSESVIKPNESMPRPPPRTRKKKALIRQGTSLIEGNHVDNNGNNSSSTDSRSMTNSIESTTPSFGLTNTLNSQNLTSILDDISSIKGDLSITDADDKRSVYLDEHILNRQMNIRSIPLFKQEMIFSNEQLKEISQNLSLHQQNKTETVGTTSNSNPKATGEVLNQIMILNIDTGEKVPLCKAENLLPKCLNPLSLHLMKLTNDYEQEDNKKKSNSIEKESTVSSIADTTIKSVTSLISSTLSDIKSDKKDKSLEKRPKRGLFNLKDSKSEKLDESLDSYELNEEDDEDEDDDDDDKNSVDFKDGKIRSKIRDLKKLGSGLIRGVKGVKAGGGKERSTFHVDLKSYSGESEPPPPLPRFKLKVNHKRGSADFDALKLVQEINDCRGAIWCMKFSNCSQLLAVAGQDHLLRVYCAQKSWKYFTQLRNKASGQHISPSSTKERGSNGDSFGRVHRSSYSRSGSLNASDNNSHNNSSSSSSSSAFAKEFYKDEDNTLSEEGPLLLFTIYRGHSADVLDLAWSKNHFLLSSSMDKTVRLWHITRIECLCTFRHIDFVTTIQFHPRDDRYFLSGSLDGKLRLWNIPDKRVTLWNEVNALPTQRGSGSSSNTGESDMSPSHGLITASSFVQNGKFAVIGTYDGRIIFYTTDQLKYFTQIHVSAKNSVTSSNGQGTSRRRRNNNKVTGIESVDDNNKILVTTNDSRLRLYDLRDLSLTCKYKGCINQSSQIKASISHDHKYISCGSENNSFYIWRLQDNSTIGQRRDRNKQYECIRLLNPPAQAQVTSPIFSNESTSNALSANSNVAKPEEKVGMSKDNLSSVPGDSFKDNNNKECPSSSVPSIGSSTTAATTTSNNNNNTAANSTGQPTAPIQQAATAATKIVTSAIFAPVPGQIDDKSRYLIATADFNGYIRIFSKH